MTEPNLRFKPEPGFTPVRQIHLLFFYLSKGWCTVYLGSVVDNARFQQEGERNSGNLSRVRESRQDRRRSETSFRVMDEILPI